MLAGALTLRFVSSMRLRRDPGDENIDPWRKANLLAIIGAGYAVAYCIDYCAAPAAICDLLS